MDRSGCRAVLWDLDGVLADTGELHYRAWQEACDEAGIPFDRDLFARTFGRNNAGALEVVLGRVPEEGFLRRFVERKEGLFRARAVGTVRPIPGVEGWLRAFRDRGLKQAVASSGPPENLEAVLGSLGFLPYFDAVVSGAELPGKPEPHVFLRAAERLGVPPASCLVVEDAVVGVRAARAAGMRVLAVATTHPAEALAEADRVLPGFEEAPDFAEFLRIP